MGLGLVLAGCSADFLRFDSPVFSLNGDTNASGSETAVAPTGSALYEQRIAEAPIDNANYAPVTGVSRGAPPAVDSYRAPPSRVASAAPVRNTPPTTTSYDRKPYVPMTTGALPARGGSITVQPGDTLYQLARRHGVSVTALQQANSLSGNVIKPGQTLVLPGGGTGAQPAPRQFASAPLGTAPRSTTAAAADGQSYTVRPGDSLYAISRRTGVSVSELKRVNGITDVRSIRPGRRLALGGTAVAPPAARTTKVASRTEYGPVSTTKSSTIQAKPIKTLPIVRPRAPAAGQSSSAYQPRILNQRPETPIATKPEQKVAMAPSPATSDSKFRWPARGRIIAPFNHSGKGTKNDGVNIALPEGTDIGAAEAGVVAYAGSELKGYGNLVLVRHDNGWVSAYAHASQVLVKRGDRITRGQVIAKAGRSGDVTQPQLHFELRKGAKPVDPMPHMAQM